MYERFRSCDLWSKRCQRKYSFWGESRRGDAGGGKAFWPEANPFASRENLGEQSEWVMLPHARLTTKEVPLSEAFNPPPPAPMALLFGQQ